MKKFQENEWESDSGEKVFPSDEEIAAASLTVGNPDGITDRKQAFEKGAHWMRYQYEKIVSGNELLRTMHEAHESGRNELILILPDGTTVDLTKPLEYSDDGQTWKFDNAYDYIGISGSGQYVFEYCGVEFYKHNHIRNKLEPEFKLGDKVWYKLSGHKEWFFGEFYDYKDGVKRVKCQLDKIFPRRDIRPAFDKDGKPVYPPFND